MYRFGFIGCGNMGGALVRSVCKSVAAGEIAVCDYSVEKTQALQKELGVQTVGAEELAKNSRFVVLGVKPQNMQETLAGISAALKENPKLTLITMAAGLSTAAILSYAGIVAPIIRIMPNTPCALGEGVVLYASNGASAEALREFRSAFKKAGKLFPMSEETLDAAGALSGCGPAFAYMFAEALANGAVECGVEKSQAVELAAQTLLGAAKMIQQYGDPVDLKIKVCSPGGTTLAGVAALEQGKFDEVTASAVTAAYARTLELKR
ncbi:MAG: pyrroline-5-carboxylate reductase [Clostridia bacterium]|nr:pyrroline-5-carboxylate reductase [Clostridia bacterium]